MSRKGIASWLLLVILSFENDHSLVCVRWKTINHLFKKKEKGMKKVAALTVIFVASLSVSAFAGQITKDQTAQCNNAQSIAIEVVATAPAYDATTGFTTNDRGAANLVVWKSSNFTTIPLTLGPNDSNQSLISKPNIGIGPRGGMGASKVVLTHQPGFSRGDSIGDISGLVKITNVGAIPVTVTCN